MDEEKRQAIEKLKAEKKEMNNLMKGYPREALQGRAVHLDAEWKKGFVAFVAIAEINKDVSKKTMSLTNQLSETFNDALKDGTQIQMTAQSKKELENVLMVKNYLIVTAELLLAPIPKLNALMTAHQHEIDKDLYLYFVGAKANFQAVLDEQRQVASDIDTTIALCFRDAIKGGADIEAIERETLGHMSTKEDIQHILENIYLSTGMS